MKRKRGTHGGGRPPKRLRNDSDQSTTATRPELDHPVLQRLYTQVFSLRQFLLSQLPKSSKNRRRRITQLGLLESPRDGRGGGLDDELGRLLDSTVVGLTAPAEAPDSTEAAKEINKEIETFSQQLPACNTGSTFRPGYFRQAPTVDFVIWLLFKRTTTSRF
ncbi:hypothetical protein BDV95DRAFT_216795 [Massariosphaeria phaeospora]|uniref:Uncharacterized protein n=1 Tax=Massariosphaeria phaeospora TaxID=100035 RepID=A0A7C8MBB5_9PLEO|nr:hypothetical protein BDV95DRAFT_216795 [Massariosphaeria phaeospora]